MRTQLRVVTIWSTLKPSVHSASFGLAVLSCEEMIRRYASVGGLIALVGTTRAQASGRLGSSVRLAKHVNTVR